MKEFLEKEISIKLYMLLIVVIVSTLLCTCVLYLNLPWYYMAPQAFKDVVENSYINSSEAQRRLDNISLEEAKLVIKTFNEYNKEMHMLLGGKK